MGNFNVRHPRNKNVYLKTLTFFKKNGFKRRMKKSVNKFSRGT